MTYYLILTTVVNVWGLYIQTFGKYSMYMSLKISKHENSEASKIFFSGIVKVVVNAGFSGFSYNFGIRRVENNISS